MKQHSPSRILNETRVGILGLSIQDFLLIVGVFGVLQLVLSVLVGPSLIPIISVVFVSVFLIFIRSQYRRHIIRDYLAYKSNQIFNLGKWYDKTYRINKL